MDLIAVRIRRKRMRAERVCSLELVAADGGELPAFSAGAHVDLHLPGGLVRPYSLCNDPSQTHRYVVAVLREAASRGGSAAVHDELREGDLLQVGAPRNHFELVPARRVLLLAGGIGITPLLSMARHLDRVGTPFRLHYSARAPQQAAFADEIGVAFADRARFHFGGRDDAAALVPAQVLADPRPDTHLYVCGPSGYIDWIAAAALDQGWSPANIHREHFAGPAPAPADAPDAGFQVRLARSGATLAVGPGQSVCQALADAGVEVPTSCEQGVCGLCLTRVIEGEIDHRDAILSADERAANDQFTPCVSRARAGCARLVLDL